MCVAGLRLPPSTCARSPGQKRWPVKPSSRCERFRSTGANSHSSPPTRKAGDRVRTSPGSSSRRLPCLRSGRSSRVGTAGSRAHHSYGGPAQNGQLWGRQDLCLWQGRSAGGLACTLDIEDDMLADDSINQLVGLPPSAPEHLPERVCTGLLPQRGEASKKADSLTSAREGQASG